MLYHHKVRKNSKHMSPLNVRSFLLLFVYSHDNHRPNERGENAAGWWARPDNTDKPGHRWVLLRPCCCLNQAEKQLIVDWVLHWHKPCSKSALQTLLQTKENEFARAQAEISGESVLFSELKHLRAQFSGERFHDGVLCFYAAELQRKLWAKSQECSGPEERYERELWTWLQLKAPAIQVLFSALILHPCVCVCVCVCVSIRRKDWIWAEGQRTEHNQKLRSSTQWVTFHRTVTHLAACFRSTSAVVMLPLFSGSVLNVISLHDELRTLRELISTADDPDRIRGEWSQFWGFFSASLSFHCHHHCLLTELTRQLEKKQDDLNSKTADIQTLVANPRISEHLFDYTNG